VAGVGEPVTVADALGSVAAMSAGVAEPITVSEAAGAGAAFAGGAAELVAWVDTLTGAAGYASGVVDAVAWADALASAVARLPTVVHRLAAPVLRAVVAPADLAHPVAPAHLAAAPAAPALAHVVQPPTLTHIIPTRVTMATPDVIQSQIAAGSKQTRVLDFTDTLAAHGENTISTCTVSVLGERGVTGLTAAAVAIVGPLCSSVVDATNALPGEVYEVAFLATCASGSKIPQTLRLTVRKV
jgi:hypothetical protein